MRTGPDNDMLGLYTPLAPQETYGFGQNLLADAPPPRMQEPDHPTVIGAQKYRNTVRRKDSQRLIGGPRQKSVGPVELVRF